MKKELFYQLYGLRVKANIEFPQLLPFEHHDDKEMDLEISVKEGDDLQKRFADTLERGGNWGITENGRWFSNQAGVFLLETVGNRSTITCERLEAIPDRVIRSFVLGNCIAIIMTQRKNLVIHGSTIVINNKTILVCGDSGTGKSTTSMELINRGGKLMADDISVLDLDVDDGKVYAMSGFPEQKLCRDAAEENGFDLNELTYIDENRNKFSVDRNEIFINAKQKVDIIVSLHIVMNETINKEFINGIKAKEIIGADKVNAITDRFFLRWLYEYSLRLEPSEMMKVFALAGQIKILDITRIQGIDTKEHLIERILEFMK